MRQSTVYTRTHRVITNRSHYAVTMQRVKNDINGNPRWEVTITDLGALIERGFAESYRYRMNGHYLDELGEAIEAVRQHEKRNS